MSDEFNEIDKRLNDIRPKHFYEDSRESSGSTRRNFQRYDDAESPELESAKNENDTGEMATFAKNLSGSSSDFSDGKLKFSPPNREKSVSDVKDKRGGIAKHFAQRFSGKFGKFSRKNQEKTVSEHTDKFRDDRPINEIVREATAGAVVFRVTKAGVLQIALFQDARDRWTIPKGHIEEGETAQETAIREVGEEIGLRSVEPVCWLGKVHFRYRRDDVLVLMSTQVYLFRAPRDDALQKEEWMHGARWFDFDEAISEVPYEDIVKLILLGKRRLEQRGEIEEK